MAGELFPLMLTSSLESARLTAVSPLAQAYIGRIGDRLAQNKGTGQPCSTQARLESQGMLQMDYLVTCYPIVTWAGLAWIWQAAELYLHFLHKKRGEGNAHCFSLWRIEALSYLIFFICLKH